MPAIKTLKLLAHGDNDRPISCDTQRSHSIMRTASLNTNKSNHENSSTQSKSLRILSSKSSNEESSMTQVDSGQRQSEDSEQVNASEDGNSQ